MPKSASNALKHVGECLYRSHTGTYYALVKVSGKQIKRSLKTSDKALAQRRLAEFRQKAERLTGSEKSLTFEALAARWLELMRPQLKASSLRRRAVCVNCLMPYFKGHLVRSIGNKEVEGWRIGRSAKLSPRSFNIELETLKLIFDYAQQDLRIILENPFERIKRRKWIAKKTEIPKKSEFQKLLQEMRREPKSGEAANFVEFLAYSGMRLGEAREVRWQDVNFDHASLIITGGEKGTKNHQFRVIPIFPPLEKLLKRISENQKSENNGNLPDKIFVIENAKKAIAGACRRAGLPHWGHHAMRHFFCSNAIEAGIDFKVIAEWLGHKDGGILVAKTYGHLRAEHSANMAKRMTFDASAES